MSYCRWSSMNWMCDLYCYEDVNGGWTTHVAGNRRVHPPSDPGNPPVGSDPEGLEWKSWWERYQASMEELGSISHEEIGLAHDGESFNDPTLEGFLDRVKMLRAAGYNVPDWLEETIEEEMAEEEGR